MHRGIFAGIACAALLGTVSADQQTPRTSPAQQNTDPNPFYQPNAVEMMRREAARLRQHVSCDDTLRCIFATNWLPVVETRTIYVREEPRSVISRAAYFALPEHEKETYKPRELDQYFYYFTRYGSPLAYLRPIDILCKELGEGSALRGKRILDFGYGGIGHLRLLASIGCEVTGIEVDPVLHALYSDEEDTGMIEGTGFEDARTPDGSLLLLHGRWPAEDQIVRDTGENYDVFLSKNTLKRGYIHPQPPEGQTVDPRRLVQLGVGDESFVRHVARVLKPGGVWMVYNISPAPAKEGEEYKPWADGRFPFDRELIDREGFEVIAWEQDDAPAMRGFARVLGWDSGNNPMDLEHDFFVNYTLLRKRAEQPAAHATPAVPVSE